jgi:hypothetical protein
MPFELRKIDGVTDAALTELQGAGYDPRTLDEAERDAMRYLGCNAELASVFLSPDGGDRIRV